MDLTWKVSMPGSEHLNDVEIERYSMGSGGDEDQALCEEHLMVCEECQGLVEESDSYVRAMRLAVAERRAQLVTPTGKQRIPSLMFVRKNRLTIE